MTGMNTLVIRSQTDRLPDVGSQIQIGIRVSAAVRLDNTDPSDFDSSAHYKEILPWLWRDYDDPAGKEWNSLASKNAWRVFAYDPDDAAKPVEISDYLYAAVDVPAKGMPNGLDDVIHTDIEELAKTKSGVCLPFEKSKDGAADVLISRTVYGLVDSLSSVPYPVPVLKKVFAAFSVDKSTITSKLGAGTAAKARLFAIPRALPTKETKAAKIDSHTPKKPNEKGWLRFDMVPETSTWANIEFDTRSSEAKPFLGTKASDKDRRMNVADLSVSRTDHDADDGRDWAARLPAALAEAVDPAARVLGVLDDTLRNWDEDRQVFSELSKVDRRIAINALRDALDLLALRVMAPRARLTREFQADLISILHDTAVNSASAEDQIEATQLLMALVASEPEKADYNISILAGRHLVRKRRLVSQTSLPTEEQLTTEKTEAGDDLSLVSDDPAPNETLESAEGFKAFIDAHWFGPSEARPSVLTAFVDKAFDPGDQRQAILGAELLDAYGIREHAGVRVRVVPGKVTGTHKFEFGTYDGAFKALREISLEQTVDSEGNPTKVIVTLTDVGTIEVQRYSESGYTIVLGRNENGLLKVKIENQPDEIVETSNKSVLVPPEFALKFHSTASVHPAPANGGLLARLSSRFTAEGARESVSLAHVAPFLPGLIGGSNWSGGTTSGSFRERVVESAKILAKRLVHDTCHKAFEALDDNLPLSGKPFAALLAAIIENVGDETGNMLRQAIPARRVADVCPPVTQTSTPLTLQIDQLPIFEAFDDLWERLAGFGVILARTKSGVEPSRWFSINAGSLTARNESDDYFVDPVAILPGEIAGVRQPIVQYDNRWLATELATDPEYDQPDNDTAHARPEKIRPPKEGRLPALSFGYDYHHAAYLIGHGGVLPKWLREDETKPLVRKAKLTGVPPNAIEPDDAVPNKRKVTWLRTRPVGPPRLMKQEGETSVLPPIPDGLVPLASELPIRPPPVTLNKTTATCFFRDASGKSGVIDLGEPSAAKNDMGEWKATNRTGIALTFRGRTPSNKKLTFRLFGRPKGGTETGAIHTPFDIRKTSEGARLILMRTATYKANGDINKNGLQVFEATEVANSVVYAEDRPQFKLNKTPIFEIEGRWDEMFISVTADGVEIEPPLLTPMAGPPDIPEFEEIGAPLPAPEAAHAARQTVLVHHFDGSAVPTKFRLRRPGIEFGTFAQWINAGILEPSTPTASRTKFKKILNQAHELMVSDSRHRDRPDDKSKNPDKDYDDPATRDFFVELIQIFPKFKTVATTVVPLASAAPFEGFQKPDGDVFEEPSEDYMIKFSVVSAGVDAGETPKPHSIQVVGANINVAASPGSIYELRISAIVPENQNGQHLPFDCLDRMSGSVAAGLRKLADGLGWAGPPQVITIEAATRVLPHAYELQWADSTDVVQFLRPPETRTDIGRIRLSEKLTDAYPDIRYVDQVSLYSQRWDWRGRPQANSASFKRFHGKDTGLELLADKAFIDRRSDDVGRVETRRIDRKHAFDGRERRGDARPSNLEDRPHLFDKNLDWRGGMNLRRLGLRLTSRYASLPRGGNLVEYTHREGGKADKWLNLLVPDRKFGRKLNRPNVSLVLPLTEALGSSDPTPPLLVLVADRMYGNFNIAEDVEAIVETARHPLPDPVTQRFWPEFGPDPIRTGRGHSGKPVPVRLDGPVGYGFDLGAEAGQFNNAGLILNTAGLQPEPWSMIKLSFRRYEHPEAMFLPLPVASGNNLKFISEPIVRNGSERFTVGSDGQMPSPSAHPADAFRFAEFEYEGLAIDLLNTKTDVADKGTRKLAISFMDIPRDERPDPFELTYALTDNRLDISLATRIGEAGNSSFDVNGATSVKLRVVVSRRPPPEGQPTWLQAGDAVVKVLIEDKNGLTENLERNRWLTVANVPILSDYGIGQERPVKDAVVARIDNRSGRSIVVRPIRLSEFTPGIWCQFTEAMSVFRMIALDPDNGDLREELVAVERMEAEVEGAELLLRCPDLTNGLDATIEINSASTPAATAQIEHKLFAVISVYEHDASDKLREVPRAIVKLPNSETADPKFDNAIRAPIKTFDKKPLPLKFAGRVRLLKVLAPKTKENGGFLDVEEDDLLSLLDVAPGEDSMNPRDASGVLLGVSRPIELRPKQSS